MVYNYKTIEDLGKRVLDGYRITREEALALINIEDSADIYTLMAWANRIKEKHHGNRVKLCSILNAKAGGCPEDCKFCAQSAHYNAESPRYGLVDKKDIINAMEEARKNNVNALGIVAAWKGITEGAILDEICERLKEMKEAGIVRPDGSFGIIKSQRVADRLKEAGLECYNHNLETSERFFPNVCTTHTIHERIQTIRYLKNAGVKICSGGIIGMGETREDRIDLALSLREVGSDVVPINILNPIKGTPFENVEPLTPLEILKTIACFRFILPTQDILIAGGRVVNLRDTQALVFMAGINALMVGNYLTTLNQPVEKDLQMLKDLGLEPYAPYVESISKTQALSAVNS
jgi:biotin synthase